MPPLSAADLDHVLEWTLPVWERLRDARLFITGGTGFFGTWLVESLAWAADRLKYQIETVVLTRAPEAFARRSPHLAAHPAVRLHRGDIRDFTFPEGQFTHVIHAAYPSGGPAEEAHETAALIVRGTERTLEFARHANAGHLLFTSSGAVYGRQPADIAAIPESFQPIEARDGLRATPERFRDMADPRMVYGACKRLAEQLCCLQGTQTSLAVKIARCFAFVGPHLPLNAHFAIGNFIRDALGGSPIHIRGDGTAVRSYLYAADLAVWLWTILIAGESGRAYNVGSPKPITTGDLARLVAREVAPAAEIQQDRQPGQAAVADRYVPDVCRAAAELQLAARIELPDAIRRTATWNRLDSAGLEVVR